MVKLLCYFCLLLPAAAVQGQPIAIFGKTDVVPLDSEAQIADVPKAVFLEALRADVARHAGWDAVLPLENPPAWGKTLSTQTAGKVAYRRTFAQGFACHLTLDHLAPVHRYILTLNGNPQKLGNNLLTESVPGHEDEKYYDFLFIETDAHGHFEQTLGIFLRPGEYDVRLYVKDTADFKIVLYRDFFRFTVGS